MRTLCAALAAGCASDLLGEVPSNHLSETTCRVELTCAGAIGEAPPAPCSLRVVAPDGALAYDRAAQVTSRDGELALDLVEYAETPLWPGASWRVHTGEPPAEGWEQPGFDDSDWPSAATPLDDGRGWLRTRAELHAWSSLTSAEIGVRGGGAATVWLAGEVLLEIGPGAEPGWTALPFDPASLAEYTNVLAVETDPGFDLYLAAAGDPMEAALTGSVAASRWVLTPDDGGCELAIDGEEQPGHALSRR
jgi:hypothetical protein